MIDWTKELPLIQAEAALWNVDYKFIAAIRAIENGAPGREFGVISVPAPSYAEQLRVTCRSVTNRLAQYEKNPLTRIPGEIRAVHYVHYNSDWIRWFGSIWAPAGASNDPKELNSNWYNNCRLRYLGFLKDGVK